MYSRSRMLLLAPILALMGCVGVVTPRNSPPVASYAVAATPDEVITCLVPAMNAAIRGMWLEPDWTQHVDTIIPGEVWEVLPQQKAIIGTGELYLVRVTMQPSGSRVELYAYGRYASNLTPAMETCSRPK